MEHGTWALQVQHVERVLGPMRNLEAECAIWRPRHARSYQETANRTANRPFLHTVPYCSAEPTSSFPQIPFFRSYAALVLPTA